MKNPLEEQLPTGHHNADQMAALLRCKSKRAFLQRLRELGWLIIDNRGVKFSDHNLPKNDIIKAGYAYIKTYSYGAGEGKQIDRTYRKAIFTQDGLEALKGIFLEHKTAPHIKPAQINTPAPQPTQPEPQHKPQQPSTTAKRERDQAIKNLRAMGFL